MILITDKILAEDIEVLHFKKDDVGEEQFKLTIECKSKEDFEAKKQQILSDREKAENEYYLTCHECKQSIVTCYMTDIEKEKAFETTIYCGICGQKFWDFQYADIVKIQQQNKKLTDEVKQLQESINELSENLNFASTKKEEYKSERDNLKEKLEKIKFRNNVLWMNAELQEILGEQNAN